MHEWSKREVITDSAKKTQLETKISRCPNKRLEHQRCRSRASVCLARPNEQNITGNVVINAEIILGKNNTEFLETNSGSLISFLDTF